MPLVNLRYKSDKFGFFEIENLRIALAELVPAAFHCEDVPDARLTPGSIEYFASPSGPHDGMHCDVFVEVEAYDFPERAAMLDDRTQQLHDALHVFFPQTTFALWPKLVKASWASDVHDPEFDGDMSMLSAAERVRDGLIHPGTTA